MIAYYWFRIKYLPRDIEYGVRNLWRWLPIIWCDRDWDWAFMARLIERKAEFMADSAEKHWCHVGAEVSVRQMRGLAKDLRDVMDEPWNDEFNTVKERIDADKAVWRRIGKTVERNMRLWWD